MRGIQYAVAYPFNHYSLRILDHPPQCAIAHKAGEDSANGGDGYRYGPPILISVTRYPATPAD
jgi:hypothetical protein